MTDIQEVNATANAPRAPYIQPSDLPANPGQTFVKVWNEQAQVYAWRRSLHTLMYRAKDGTLHAYRPGVSKEQDAAFRLFATKRGPLTLVGRKERRQMYREEKARYRALLKDRRDPMLDGIRLEVAP